MSERAAPPDRDRTNRLIPEPVVPPMTFIVRVTATTAGRVIGVVEHPGTGRKERFEGLDALASVIAALRASVGGPQIRPG